MGAEQKDGWDKAQIVLAPVGALLTALAVVWIGFLTNRHLNQRQEVDAKQRLYSELMSRREDSESSLRKDMFGSIITTFLSNQKPRVPSQEAELETEVLNLELLAYNFHESLNLSPLFYHLERAIARTSLDSVRQERYLNRLRNVAREINRREGDLLEAAGDASEWNIDLDSLPTAAEATLTVNQVKRVFQVTALGVDAERRQIPVELEVVRLDSRGQPHERTRAKFTVGFFDFPMIDNTRLSDDQRCSVVLDLFEGHHARLRLLYFPGSHASLRERPYYEDILEKLRREGEGT